MPLERGGHRKQARHPLPSVQVGMVSTGGTDRKVSRPGFPGTIKEDAPAQGQHRWRES